MSDNIRRITDATSDTMAPVISQQNYDANVDYIINEYMERLGTRLNILETELKYAWRALDLLSQEYIKMWERLEKLEGLLCEQQSVISQLLDFYTSGGSMATGCHQRMSGGATSVLDNRLGELEVIREILGNGTVEDGLEEGLDVSRAQPTVIQELDIDEMHVPDEAFYRSLNQAYRDDLVGCDLSAQNNQLGMIWEEREEIEENVDKKKELEKSLHLDETEEVYSALDYKDYRGDSPCVNEQDIAQLSRIDTIDHVTIEKLNELDRLSNKLQQDSDNIKQLQRKLLESPLTSLVEGTDTKQDNQKSLDDHLCQIYNDNENWSFSSNARDQDEIILLAKSELPNSLSNATYSTRPNSRLSVTDSVIGTDSEVAEALAGGIRTPTSPRRHKIEVTSCSAPFTTVTGRLAYSAAVQHVEAAEAANSKNPFYCSSTELNALIAASYETVPCSTPSIFSVKSEKAQSPTLSICSVRTRQDGYIGGATMNPEEIQIAPSPSPPPPAPLDICENFMDNTIGSELQTGPVLPVFLGTTTTTTTDTVPSSSINSLDPKIHSPKSPRMSPKKCKNHSSNIGAAKSDSGLSSMSGWSSLEKSPGSPKTKPSALNYYPDSRLTSNRAMSTTPVSCSTQIDPRPFLESETDSLITVQNTTLPGGHHLSAFTTVKSPCSLETTEGYGTFVPAPAPVSDINVSPRRKSKHQLTKTNSPTIGEFMFRNDQPAIYSVAGSNRDSYTSVYTSNSADYISQTINYPDLVEPYENNEFHSSQQRQLSYNSLTTIAEQQTNITRRKSLSRTLSNNNGSDGLANHEGYKTAMYRTMFPSGNITDALSYYPTSSRYESAVGPLQSDYNNPGSWLNCPSDNNQYYQDNAEMYNQSSYIDPRRHQQRQDNRYVQQPIYENQQQIEQHTRNWNQRQEIPYLELDLRNCNVPEYVVQQQQEEQQQQQQPQSLDDNKYFEPTGVIMTQSGYITISSDMNENRDEKKKMKRGNTLKSAMNSVSHWLPDLHLTKRHRSYSLPSGVRREDIERTRNSHAKTNVAASRKKKRNPIVSTVSGILQKAKRKTTQTPTHHTQSLSDPEQSENEWVIQRTRSVVSEDDHSEDSYSLFSENQSERDHLFAKVTKTKTTCQDKCEDEQLSNNFEQLIISSPPTNEISPKLENDSGGGNIEEEICGKSTGSGSSSIFATIGEAKKSSTSSDKSDETVITESKMVVVVGGASMEFAVSRALGKYRQRQTSSISDDQLSIEEPGVVIEELIEDDQTNKDKVDEEAEEMKKVEKLPEQKSTESQNSDLSRFDDNQLPEGSPSSCSLRAHNRFLPRHQQSLDIPHLDDDNRSTHSWRSTSRVSSRRQSTEDSIDSEDEWYCYELRKLEEMERQSQLELEMGETLKEEPELEEMYEPYEEVKEKMSFVLRELRMKAKVVDGVLDEKDNNLQTIQSAKHRENDRKSIQLEEAHLLFGKIGDVRGVEDENFEEQQQQTVDVKEAKPTVEGDEEHSSGETSGPDSPHMSGDEEEDVEQQIHDNFPRCHIVQQKESNKMETTNDEENQNEPINVPKINVESDVGGSVVAVKDEPTKEPSQAGSKWKLLKALKERKAEEKSGQVKVTTETTQEKETKVSMLGMMQKFYEIHVKT